MGLHGSRRLVICARLLTMTVFMNAYCHGEEKAPNPRGREFVSNKTHEEGTALIPCGSTCIGSVAKKATGPP
jgi:hypothetical protein